MKEETPWRIVDSPAAAIGTLCWYDVKPDLGFVGMGEHEDAEEAKRLAYDDAYAKAHIVSIQNLAMYRQWKQHKQRGKP